MTTLPAVAKAKLPETYSAAKQALAQCARIDEAKDWADKAAAMASYAKQAEDKSLQNLATKIRARAIRRCGELLKEIERPEQGGRPKRNGTATGTVLTRDQAAKDAGLSKRQKDTAIRVANVPADEFEAAVESDDPPTVTELAERGKKSPPAKRRPLIDLGERTPEDFRALIAGGGAIDTFCRATEGLDPAAVARGERSDLRDELASKARRVRAWIDNLIQELER